LDYSCFQADFRREVTYGRQSRPAGVTPLAGHEGFARAQCHPDIVSRAGRKTSEEIFRVTTQAGPELKAPLGSSG
jgi:hypothetical protein